MLRRDSPTPREHMSERLWMRDRMALLHSVCHHHEFFKTSHRGSHETCSPQVLTEPRGVPVLMRTARRLTLRFSSVPQSRGYAVHVPPASGSAQQNLRSGPERKSDRQG